MERGRGDGGGGEGVDVTSGHGKEIVDALVAMGIGREVAEMGVRETGGDTAESAIAWVFENGGGGGGTGSGGRREVEGELEVEYKMVFVVNMALPMTPGKMAAQVGHAALGLYQELVSKQDVHGGSLLQWNENGGKKIVLQCKDAEHMNQLASQAQKVGLPFIIIQDAGHTQIPAGSQTVLGVFGDDKEVDKITGQLRLLP